jgi:ferrous iron transport protein A
MKLHELKAGQKAEIKNMDLESLPIKLMDMGCLPGSEVELILKAPLGDPFYFKIDGLPLCIRKEMASQIEIELLSNGN